MLDNPPHQTAVAPAGGGAPIAPRAGWSHDDGALDRDMARTSDLLRRSIQSHPAERITVAELLGALGDRGFGLLIVLLVLPNFIPGPPIPGYSMSFAAGIALVASQLARGFQRPQLPGWLLRRSFARARLDALLARAMPLVRRFERFAHARPSTWTSRRAERWIGGICIAVAAALAIPVPLGNTPPAIALLVLGIGLIERDGRLLALGTAIGAAAIAYVGVLSALTLTAAGWLLGG